jgi:hypothetical protein
MGAIGQDVHLIATHYNARFPAVGGTMRSLSATSVKGFRFKAAFGCAALAALPLAACATSQQQWYRADATQQDFAMDQGQCQAQGFSVPGASVLQAALVYNACMRGKGWEQH